jgi:hypothetical protein
MRSIPDYFWPANLKRTLRRAATDPQAGRVGGRLQVAVILAMSRWSAIAPGVAERCFRVFVR